MAIPAPSRIRVRFAAAALSAVCAFHAVVHAASPVPDRVSLSESTITWSTVKYATNAENGFVSGSLDKKTIVDRTFSTHVLENRYLKVTLVPEFGGRILSIIYKPTGHEQLYRTEVGVPYGIGGDIFYYDWLMVYGGIFPTFPDPEHGRTWLKRWDFKVVKESAGEVTVSMSLKDDFEYSAAPKRFRGSTGIEATYYVTLKADRAALDARVVLKNPHDRAIKYEYWTCTTLAPGSDPKNPKTTGGAEIIAPIQAYSTPHWSANLAEGDKSLGLGKSRFEKLRYFRNWPTMGIAYAAPDMQGGNFWGVINHDNEEGIIRIADNTVTPGLKMWTWGFPSFTNETDARKDPNEQRPYIELWAGVSDQFFHSANVSRTGRGVGSRNLQPDRRHEQRDACQREHPDQSLGRGVRRQSSVLQYRTGDAVARNAETRRRGIVRRRRDSRPEKRKSRFRGNSCRRQRRTGTADDQDRGRQGADRGRDKDKIDSVHCKQSAGSMALLARGDAMTMSGLVIRVILTAYR